jgi:hypothetical protein
MRLLIPRDPPRDSGYPLDGDLQQMTDDGCPIVPDSSADPDWRDNLGEYDTFADDVGLDLPTGSPVVQRRGVRSGREPPGGSLDSSSVTRR